MRAAARITAASMFIAVFGISGCKLETSEILAADRLIEHVNAGSSGGGVVDKRVETGISLGPDSATRIYYQFVDSRGQVRFVDRLTDIPAEWRERVGFVELDSPPPLSPMAARQARSDLSAGASGAGAPGRLIFYTADWCPWCSKAKTHMDRNGIDYEARDIDNPAILAELVEKTGQQGVPVFDVDGRILTGFDPNRLEQLVAGG